MKLRQIFALSVIFSLAGNHGSATVFEAPIGRINMLYGGWNEPNLRILLDTPQYNPENCTEPWGYMIPANSPANQQLTAMALTAYSLKHRVRIMVDGCHNNTPKVIGIQLLE